MIRVLLIALGYLLLSQLIPVLICAPFVYLSNTLSGAPADVSGQGLLLPGLAIGDVLVVCVLWWKGFFKNNRASFALVSWRFMLWTAGVMLSAILLSDYLMRFLTFLPDWNAEDIVQVLDNPLGIALIAVIGPVIEELVFRGVITKQLLARYRPWPAILASAAIFGLIHINPAQIPVAFALGILFGWLYYRSRSVVPGILMHILNNSLSVWLQLNFPQDETLQETVGTAYYLLLALAVVVFVVAMWRCPAVRANQNS
ncbi:MAG: CPBP family intramembrane metalloprotease [Prevotellaceae bacterium]|jgi:membrane protease YdiL (CAAX protease family)|nr:CPBP family intramembrane metalloprotease [Prevotellaceae bacterium]